jgi:hypothetical protein
MPDTAEFYPFNPPLNLSTKNPTEKASNLGTFNLSPPFSRKTEGTKS